MFNTTIGNMWNIVFSTLVYTNLWIVLLIFCPKVLLVMLITYFVSLLFVKWWV